MNDEFNNFDPMVHTVDRPEELFHLELDLPRTQIRNLEEVPLPHFQELQDQQKIFASLYHLVLVLVLVLKKNVITMGTIFLPSSLSAGMYEEYTMRF
jgi:hypothetical protein